MAQHGMVLMASQGWAREVGPELHWARISCNPLKYFNVMEWMFLQFLFVHVFNKYIGPNLKYKVLIIDHSNVAWNLKIFILYSPQSPYKITKNLKFISLPFGQDVLSSPQWTRCSPSLVNEANQVSARHPGDSFLVNLPLEAVPNPTNSNPLPSQPWSTPFHCA